MAGEVFSEFKFQELEINKDIKRGIHKLGFDQMTPIQAEAIPVLLKGKDVIGQAQTGTGKTAAFGIPLLEKIDPKNKKLQAIVLCPTRELAMQVAQEIRSFASYMHDVKLLPVYGGQEIRRQIQGLKGTQIVVGTPGRVMDHMRRHTIRMDDVSMCILDEADEMLKMGFREDMEVILGAIEHPHQTCLFSATMPQEILDLTNRFQCNPTLIKVAAKELTMERIKQYYYAVKREYKVQALIRLLAYYQYQKTIIFCNTKVMTEELETVLKEEGYQAEALHGDLSQKQRDIVMGHFRSGASNILIATDIAARGLDVDDVEAVFNFDVPQEIEYYVHRIGRTGRAGKEGVSHTLCTNRDFKRIHEIEEVCRSTMEECKIPSPAAITDMKIKSVLRNVKEVIGDYSSLEYLGVIRGYCASQGIDGEQLAAAFLKMELGEMPDEIEIDLPGKEKKSRRRRKGSERGERKEDGTGRKKRTEEKEDQNRKGKSDRFHRKDKEENRGKSDRKEKIGKKEKVGNQSDRRDNREKREKKENRKKIGKYDSHKILKKIVTKEKSKEKRKKR